MEKKKELRKQILALRDAMPEEEREEKSSRITETLLALPLYREAEAVLTYVNYLSEVNTTDLVNNALSDHKRVFAPRVSGETMEFYQITEMKDLKEGYRGIREPVSRRRFNAVTDAGPALMLMPGAVFDEKCHRIGYGKGFYDKYLNRLREKGAAVHTLALCYECQILPEIPVEEHDIRPQMILTEERIRMSGKEQDMAMDNLEELGKRAEAAKYQLQTLSAERKNAALQAVAEAFLEREQEVLAANERDRRAGEEGGMRPAMLDRLRLTEERIHAMADGLLEIAKLPDPVGEVLERFDRPNGLHITKLRVPFGVIGIIYEARPNVTADAFGLCFKTGNAVILKGGKEALHSNIAISDIIRETLAAEGITEDALLFITDTDRQVTNAFMKLNRYVDVLIPRGGAGLIRAVVENSTIPVIETGTGNCHIYIDEEADIGKAVPIVLNAKTQRIGVCNACESLVIHEKIADKLLPALGKALRENHVEMRGDGRAIELIPGCLPATEEDYGTEYLDYMISIKTVSSLEEAIAHINRYTTRHSDAILTENEEHARRFLQSVDSACVYVNASTRFTDGFEFGFGAEIGISTQKLHARGPMGLRELTTYKYTIIGNGQTRP
ncbi:MAG: glutamate-5-semialdehyde dehydrogenase [Bacteroides fragilis]|nr:glutamate-5-semialdehyde dehydrogenase [Bacteroides fragilis]